MFCLGWLFWGAVIWVIAIFVKIKIAKPFDVFAKEFNAKTYSSLWGFVSALCELGSTIIFFLMIPAISIWQVFFFGAGAGLCEMIWLLSKAIARQNEINNGVEEFLKLPLYIRYTFWIERSLALLLHISSRGLVYLGLTGLVWPTIVGTVIFLLGDGVTTYGHLLKWNWLNPRIWKRYYGFLACLSMPSIILLLIMSA